MNDNVERTDVRPRNPLGTIFGLFLLANVAYAAKSAMGIDLLPGHNADLFPFGDWVFQALGGKY